MSIFNLHSLSDPLEILLGLPLSLIPLKIDLASQKCTNIIFGKKNYMHNLKTKCPPYSRAKVFKKFQNIIEHGTCHNLAKILQATHALFYVWRSACLENYIFYF